MGRGPRGVKRAFSGACGSASDGVSAPGSVTVSARDSLYESAVIPLAMP